MNAAVIEKHLNTIETCNADIGRFATVLDLMSYAIANTEGAHYNRADAGDSLQAIARAIERLYNSVYDAKEAIESEIRQYSL